jgi:hypothetical protein
MIPEGPLGFIAWLAIGGVFYLISRALRSAWNDREQVNGTRPKYERRR